jgi:hypothetical protein
VETVFSLYLILISKIPSVAVYYGVILKELYLIGSLGLAEVNDLDVVIGIKHDVATLNIPMHHLLLLHILSKVYHLSHVDLGQRLLLLVSS